MLPGTLPPTYKWSRVDELKCLGVMISSNASSNRAVAYRCHAAEITMAKKAAAFRCHLPFPIKIRAWQQHGQAAAAYGAEILHVNREVLLSLMRWENIQVRRALCLRPHSNEGPTSYNTRAARTVRQVFDASGVPRLHHRVLRRVLKCAIKTDGVCRSVQQERDWHWRTVANANGYKRRKAQRSVQARSGRRTAWDDWLSSVYGSTWDEVLRKDATSPAGLRKLIHQACVYFELPCPS